MRKKTKEVLEKRRVPSKEAGTASKDDDRAEQISEVEKGLCKIAGVFDKRTAYRIMSQLQAMLIWTPSNTTPGGRFMAAFETLAELKPTNMSESLLAVQMIGVHEAAVRFLRNATIQAQTVEGQDINMLRAIKLMRLFNEQLEAMAKLKGKVGQQKVVVEHVHVHKGGQAIVGTVTAAKEPLGERGK